MTTHLFLLADGRFPAGGHAHSATTEAAIEKRVVVDAASLQHFLTNRLRTNGLVDASFCAKAITDGPDSWDTLDSEYEARTWSPSLRQVSRRLGRQLFNTAAGVWPGTEQSLRIQSQDCDWCYPIAFGQVAHARNIQAHDAAHVVLYQLATSITTAAVRLLGLDPTVATRCIGQQDQTMSSITAEAIDVCQSDVSTLPSLSNPLIDILAECHDRSDMKLFAS